MDYTLIKANTKTMNSVNPNKPTPQQNHCLAKVYTWKMLVWLVKQPNQETDLHKTPYYACNWRVLIKSGVLEGIKQYNSVSRARLKSNEEVTKALSVLKIRLPYKSSSKLLSNTTPIFSVGEINKLLFLRKQENEKLIEIKQNNHLSCLGDDLFFTIPKENKTKDFSLQKQPQQEEKLVSLEKEYSFPIPVKRQTNQGRGAEIKWKHLSFRSEHEVAIASELDTIGVMFLPNAAVRITENGDRVTKEVDFLVCKNGRWGILEVDGAQHRESRAEDMMRDDAFTDAGVWFIRRYPAAMCIEKPTWVAQDFITRLDTYYSRLK